MIQRQKHKNFEFLFRIKFKYIFQEIRSDVAQCKIKVKNIKIPTKKKRNNKNINLTRKGQRIRNCHSIKKNGTSDWTIAHRGK